MTKTLKIAVFLVGALTLGSFVLFIFFLFKPDTKVEEFFSTKGEVEKFIVSATAPKSDESLDSPLVTQAEAFALRIDPPPPPTPVNVELEPSLPGPEIQQAPANTDFKLAGTVVSGDPRYSLALLDTTAKGIRWYRKNDKIGNQTIEQILGDRIIINDGTKKYEMQVPAKQKISLLKGDPNNPYTSQKLNPYKTILSLPVPAHSAPVTSDAVVPAIQQPEIETPKMTTEMIKENIEFLTQLANDPESMGMTKEEAAQLGDMSEFVEQLEKEAAETQKLEANQPSQETATPTPAPAPNPKPAPKRSRRAR